LSRVTLHAATGVLVMAAGLTALWGVADSASEEPAQEILQPILLPEVPAPATSAIEGVDASVQRVLQAYGRAEVKTAEQLDVLPPEVARVLIHRRVTLLVPEGGAG
jgi:hypothetical protein